MELRGGDKILIKYQRVTDWQTYSHVRPDRRIY